LFYLLLQVIRSTEQVSRKGAKNNKRRRQSPIGCIPGLEYKRGLLRFFWGARWV